MVNREPQDKLDLKGHQGHRETLDLLGILVLMDHLEPAVLLDNLD